MKRLVMIVTAFVLLILFGTTVLRKYRIPLTSNGKVVGFTTRPLGFADKEFAVFATTNEVFALWGDIFDFPVFIHAFPDSKRFLCIYDYDTAVLVFVVDNDASARSVSNEWPSDDYLRDCLSRSMTNVVLRTQGKVRLPTLVEVQEVSSNLALFTPRQYKSAALPTLDLGLYRCYWPKSLLLKEVSPDRKSPWPQLK